MLKQAGGTRDGLTLLQCTTSEIAIVTLSPGVLGRVSLLGRTATDVSSVLEVIQPLCYPCRWCCLFESRHPYAAHGGGWDTVVCFPESEALPLPLMPKRGEME